MYDFKGLSNDAKTAIRVDAVMRISQAHQAKLDEARVAADLKTEQEIGHRQVMADILRENEQKRLVEEQRMRELSNKNLEADLRRRFLAANPSATETSWLSVKEQIKQDYFVERFNAEQSREQLEVQKYVPM
jgi:single-stranded DNA-specific DHH superfamily exonuclease